MEITWIRIHYFPVWIRIRISIKIKWILSKNINIKFLFQFLIGLFCVQYFLKLSLFLIFFICLLFKSLTYSYFLRNWQLRRLARDLSSLAESRRAEKNKLLISEPHRANHQTLIVFLRFHGFISIFNYLCNFTMNSDKMAMAGITRSVLRPCRHFVGNIFRLKNNSNMIDCSL